MKKYFITILLVLIYSVGFVPEMASAITAPPPIATPAGLSIVEIKITGNEFLMLQNNTGVTITDLSKYWLYDFNNMNPLASGVSSSTQQLPGGSLGNGQILLLSANGGQTCGAAVTGKLSVSLTDSGGFLEIVQTSLSGGVLIQTAGDAVSWSSGVNPTAGMITNVPSSTADPNGAFYRYQNSVPTPPYLWQQATLDSTNQCQMNVVIAGKAVAGPSNPGNQLLPGDMPPVTFITDTAPDPNAALTGTPGLPPSDIGLKSPQINELLPNPAEPQTDSENEYIELYNSNDTVFDLSGFKLQTGTTTKHSYTFPAGTTLPAKGFVAFMSEDTGLSLSNSGGQAGLLDPTGNSISQSDAYGTAKDGQAWALGNGSWYWTDTPTPNAANVIKSPLSITSLSVGSTAAKTAVVKKAATTKKAAAPKVKDAKTIKTSAKPKAASSDFNHPAAAASPIHLQILAGIGALALLYALHEYRNDLRNTIYRIRRYRTNRRTVGEPAQD